MKKKIIILATFFVMVLFALSACADRAATAVEKAALENFDFNNAPHTNEYLDLTLDEGLSVDGILDEKVWEDNGTAWTFQHSSGTETNPISMTSMSYLGDNGVYMALSVKDTAIYYSSDRKASGNTSVEVYVGAFDAIEWDGNSYRISIVPTSADTCMTEMRTYRTKTAAFDDKGSTLNAEWSLWYKAHIAGSRINGAGINTSFNEGYDIELFIPYESLGINSKPQAIQYMTAFYHVESESSNADNTWTKCDQNVGVTTLGGWLVATNDEIGFYADMLDKINAHPDSYMTIDGNLDENVYKSDGALEYTVSNATYGVSASISTLTHLSDKGVYIGVETRDNKIYATSNRNIKFNSSIELWIQASSNTHVSNNSLQIRLDALGAVSKWRGTGKSDNGFIEKYFASLSAVKLLGCAEENGEIAAEDAIGFNAEIFIPWSELGFVEKQEEISVYPCYVHAGDNTNTTNTTSANWIYFQPCNQSTAKNDSLNAFFCMYDGGFSAELFVNDILFSGGDLDSDDTFTTSVIVEKLPSVTLLGGNATRKPVTDANITMAGVTFTHLSGGVYTFAIESVYIDSYADGKKLQINAGRLSAEINVLFLSVDFDGKADSSDGYTTPYSFLTTDSSSHNNETTVYSRVSKTGVSFALVLDTEYINFGANTSGNNGGGFEIRMANAKNSSSGLWWRVFADGTSRQETNLSAGAPSGARYKSPIGSSAFAVGLIANDVNNLSKGYKQMTVEFFVSFAAINATNADDFFIAIGVNGTKADNTTLAVRWLDGTGTTAPSTDNWLSVTDMTEFTIPDFSVTATNGSASFRLITSLSDNTYIKGASFDIEAEEKAFGYYMISVNSSATLYAVLGNKKATITVETVQAPILNGAIDIEEYSGHFGFRITNTAEDFADIEIYYYEGSDAVYIAFSVTSNSERTLKNTASGNQGSAGVNFAVATNNFSKANYYRAYASGRIRMTSFTSSNVTTPGNPVTVNYMAGSHTVDPETTVSNIKSYVLEWRINYADYGVTSADELQFMFGWLTSTMGDRGFSKSGQNTFSIATGASSELLKSTHYYTIADIIAAAGAAN